MDWKQIETKWAEMARRICADAPGADCIDMTNVRVGKADMSSDIKVKQVVASDTQSDQVPQPESTH